MSTKHTPKPWRVFESNQTPFPIHHILCNDVISGLATMNRGSTTENEANAHHIVKCVNLHDELVEALEQCIEREEDPYYRETDFFTGLQSLLIRAKNGV